jgi:hypothetical protein
MIKEYTVITSMSGEELITQVNSHIKEGWQPIGGITSIIIRFASPHNEGQFTFSQAMIKY